MAMVKCVFVLCLLTILICGAFSRRYPKRRKCEYCKSWHDCKPCHGKHAICHDNLCFCELPQECDVNGKPDKSVCICPKWCPKACIRDGTHWHCACGDDVKGCPPIHHVFPHYRH